MYTKKALILTIMITRRTAKVITIFFSFAQLDDCFLPSQFSKVSIDLPVLFLLTPTIRFQLNQLAERSKVQVGYYKEFPPPIDYLSHLFSRPPPTC